MTQYDTTGLGEWFRLSFSKSISFTGKDLLTWIGKVISAQKYDNIKICLGIYTQDYVTTYKLPSRLVGRLTMFLCPCIDFKIAPGPSNKYYNLGGLEP